jgi:hypothetical protein
MSNKGDGTMSENSTVTEKKVKAKDHESYGTFTVLAIIIPLVGFILGIVYLTKDKKVDKKLGEHLVALSVLFGAFWWVLLTMFVFKATTTVPIATTPSVPTTSEVTTPKPTTAHVGSAINIGGGSGLQVTVQQIIDPASSGNQYLSADAGKRFVAVKLQIVNKGDAAYTDNANNNVALVGSDNQTATVSFYPITDCTSFSNGTYTLTAGASATGCVVFQLPNGVNSAKVQFKTNSGFSGSAGEWLNP